MDVGRLKRKDSEDETEREGERAGALKRKETAQRVFLTGIRIGMGKIREQ